MKNQKPPNIIFLPNIDICVVLNNSTLGVFIGIFTGFGMEIIMNKLIFWWISLFFFFAVVFLIIAAFMNQNYINLIKNGIVNHNERIKETVEKLKKFAYENIKECREAVQCYIGCIILSGILIILGIFLYVLNNSSTGNI